MLWAHLRERLEPVRVGLRPVDLEQDLPEVLADRDRCVGGGVDASGDCAPHLSECDLVAHEDRGLEARPAGLLDIVRRGLGGELRAEHALARQVEVATVLEHGSGGHLVEDFALEAKLAHEGVDCRREHVLVRCLCVGPVLAGERNPDAAENCDAA